MRPHDHANRAARRQVEPRIGLGIHLAVYLTVNTGLILLNLLVAPQRTWSAGESGYYFTAWPSFCTRRPPAGSSA